MRVTAHRGFAMDTVENTVGAVEDAVSSGVVDAVEVDVRRCRSGEIVVIHDEFLGRLTGGELECRVGEVSYDELSSVELVSGGSVPLLEDIVGVIPSGVELNVELKERGLVDDVVPILDGCSGSCFVQSFDIECVRSVAESDFTGSVGFLLWAVYDDVVAQAVAVGCDRVNVCLEMVSVGDVERLQSNGFEVDLWTVRDAGEFAFVRSCGADGAIVDSAEFI